MGSTRRAEAIRVTVCLARSHAQREARTTASRPRRMRYARGRRSRGSWTRKMATPEEREARETRSGTEPFFFPSQHTFPQLSSRTTSSPTTSRFRGDLRNRDCVRPIAWPLGSPGNCALRRATSPRGASHNDTTSRPVATLSKMSAVASAVRFEPAVRAPRARPVYPSATRASVSPTTDGLSGSRSDRNRMRHPRGEG